MRPRSYLYVPGNAEERLFKAPTRGADALIVDLEDAVPPAGRVEARLTVRRWLDSLGEDAPQIWVRVNPGDELAADLDAVVGAPMLHGIVLAKTESVEEVVELDDLLTQRGDALTAVMPLLESAQSVLDAREIAGGPRVECLQVGEFDFRSNTGIRPGPDESELLYARSHAVLASAAQSLPPPVGPVSTEIRDLDVFRSSTEALMRLSYLSRACIHPAQVAVTHEVMTPSDEERAAATRLLESFDAAMRDGRAVLTDDAGRLLDEAVIKQARRLLAIPVRP